MFSLSEPQSKEEWNDAAVSLGASFAQSFEYGEMQKKMGRKVIRCILKKDGDLVGILALISFPLPFSKCYLYAPFGPALKDSSEDVLRFLKEKISEIVKKEGAVFARLELPKEANGKKVFVKPRGRAKEGSYFQPRTDWQLSLVNSNEEIIQNMNQSARRALRRSEENNVITEILPVTDKSVQKDFFSLMNDTAKRNNFRLHAENYYVGALESLKESSAFFVRTKVLGETVVTLLIFVFGKEAMYLFGASSDDKKESGATLFSQLKAMEEARERGALIYNFGAVSSHSGASKFDGITTFKKKFGGYEKWHGDFFDIVGSPLFYTLYVIRKFLRI